MPDQSKYTSKLNGARILVLGGTSGIGYGVAEAAIENGATVVISSSSLSKVDDKVAKLKSLYPSATSRISGHACDLGDLKTLEANIVTLLDSAGKLDHIVHTAGDSLAIKKLTEIDIDFVTKAGAVRFFAPLMIAKHAPKYLTGGPRSSIIITSGAVAQRPSPDWVVVNSYLTGLEGMTRGLAFDLKPIRVNLVIPGAVDTELWKMPEEEKKAFLDSIAKVVPTGKVGQVEDVAESYMYLLKNQNATGSVVSTNAGHLLV